MTPPAIAKARLIALLVPLALLGGAWGSQLFGGLYPCEMCHWQRWPHYAAVPIALAAFFVKQPFMRATLICLAAASVAVSGAIGVFHAGVEYGWWPGITGCTATADLGLSDADLLNSINDRPLIRCDEPQWTLLGVSLAGFNAIISLGSAILIFALVGRRRAA
ncbi:disulfide bond formation protein B [Stakelama tenebrarum]|uniref:Disulfide bond formation protein B n=1 Tax=Stakelama tenebrarum TaxID=2711215 RepID=A0A6G6Y0M8_9SPHN|nr:disulfide bond formation protein B [Sphingosinithalassobacter tenebrarum]QIG78459.1 disulfide bond formation protein B [Sphingosinithalassobacter tenebrarum]